MQGLQRKRRRADSALQQSDKAGEKLQAASELDPDDADTYVYLADVWGKLGEYEKAVEATDKALALNPKSPLLMDFALFGR